MLSERKMARSEQLGRSPNGPEPGRQTRAATAALSAAVVILLATTGWLAWASAGVRSELTDARSANEATSRQLDKARADLADYAVIQGQVEKLSRSLKQERRRTQELEAQAQELEAQVSAAQRHAEWGDGCLDHISVAFNSVIYKVDFYDAYTNAVNNSDDCRALGWTVSRQGI